MNVINGLCPSEESIETAQTCLPKAASGTNSKHLWKQKDFLKERMMPRHPLLYFFLCTNVTACFLITPDVSSAKDHNLSLYQPLIWTIKCGVSFVYEKFFWCVAEAGCRIDNCKQGTDTVTREAREDTVKDQTIQQLLLNNDTTITTSNSIPLQHSCLWRPLVIMISDDLQATYKTVTALFHIKDNYLGNFN